MGSRASEASARWHVLGAGCPLPVVDVDARKERGMLQEHPFPRDTALLFPLGELLGEVLVSEAFSASKLFSR